MTLSRQKELGEPSPEELIEALQNVNEALHRLGGAWQLLPGKVRARLVSESQRIEDLLDRAAALPLPPSPSRDPHLRHLPPPALAARGTKPIILGRTRPRSQKESAAASDNP
jgi:hypothetical protein